MASNMLWLEILHKFGGVCVDVNYLCVAPLDGILLLSKGNILGTEESNAKTGPIQSFYGASNIR